MEYFTYFAFIRFYHNTSPFTLSVRSQLINLKSFNAERQKGHREAVFLDKFMGNKLK